MNKLEEIDKENHLLSALTDVEDYEQRAGTLKSAKHAPSRCAQEPELFPATKSTIRDSHRMDTNTMEIDTSESTNLPNETLGEEVVKTRSPYMQSLKDIDIDDLLNECRKVARLLRD